MRREDNNAAGDIKTIAVTVVVPSYDQELNRAPSKEIHTISVSDCEANDYAADNSRDPKLSRIMLRVSARF